MNGKLFTITSIISLLVIGCAAAKSPPPEPYLPKNPVSVQQQSRVLFHHQTGLKLMDQDRLQDAFIEFNKSIALDPSNARSWLQLGFIYHRWDDLDREIDSYQRAIRAQPDFRDAQLNLANACFERNDPQLGDLKTSEKAYRNVLNAKTKLPQARRNLGLILEATKRYSEAIRQFQKFLDEYPEDPWADIVRKHLRELSTRS